MMCEMPKISSSAAPSFNVEIHMAGCFSEASMVLQRRAAKIGMCVTIQPQSFIYSGGREEGFRVGLINYPRFPSSPAEMTLLARVLADELMEQLGQNSYSIVTPSETEWVSRRKV